MSALYRRNPDMVATEMDGDFVIVTVGTDKYYHTLRSGPPI